MNFVDEAIIRVIGGKGGNGALSFLREKYRPKGGPDGGDGGNGGSIYLTADSGLNTLADFRYTRLYRARNGQPGAGRERAGKCGDDLVIRVPLGTMVLDHETGELIGDVVDSGIPLLVARGGVRGLGNARFKSSTNQAPRRTTPGRPGEEHLLRLELKVLADVGLLGKPNAGKSTLLSVISSARPKVADYPFTTLHPQLGVVDVGESTGFVVADIPGLISGAARGAGLGIDFLKHLSRTRILVHLVDVAPPDESDPVASIREVEEELAEFGHGLAARERWLVFNKCDLLSAESVAGIRDELIGRLQWTGRVHAISAATSSGCQDLVNALMKRLDELAETFPGGVSEEPDPAGNADG